MSTSTNTQTIISLGRTVAMMQRTIDELTERIRRVEALADRTLTLGGPEHEAWVNLADLRNALGLPLVAVPARLRRGGDNGGTAA